MSERGVFDTWVDFAVITFVVFFRQTLSARFSFFKHLSPDSCSFFTHLLPVQYLAILTFQIRSQPSYVIGISLAEFY